MKYQIEEIENGTVTTTPGFKAAGTHCGIKKRKKDLALIYSESPCEAGGVSTTNLVKAAPNHITDAIIHSGKAVRGILVNSGNANACTGQDGFNRAKAVQEHYARALGIKTDELIIASTGVIGVELQSDTIIAGSEEIVSALDYNGGLDAAEAIMTTDLRPKFRAMKVSGDFGTFTIGGMCKGSGMINPNMATMLAYLTTDIQINRDELQDALVRAVNRTFNRISVDGDTSTNDMVVILANHSSGVVYTKVKDAFEEALYRLCYFLAHAIIADGEGVTKIITLNIINAASEKDADILGEKISCSPLVKTAFHGEDPNWGRLMGVVGRAGIPVDPAKVRILFEDYCLLDTDYKVSFDEEYLRSILAKKEITLTIDLNMGTHSVQWLTCDFSKQYIEINASYRT